MGDNLRAPVLASSVLVIAALLACQRQPGEGDTGEGERRAREQERQAKAAAEAAGRAASASAAASAQAAPSSAPELTVKQKAALAKAKTLAPEGWHVPDEASKPPTVKEWNAAEKHAVRHARELGCEGKFVREWIRMSCRSASGVADPIQGVERLKPRSKPTHYYDFVREGRVASVVVPVRRTTDMRIEFIWKTFRRTLTVKHGPTLKHPVVYFTGKAPPDAGKKLCSKVCPLGPAQTVASYCMPQSNAKVPWQKCDSGYSCNGAWLCLCDAYGDGCVDDY